MGADDVATVEMLTAYRNAMTELIIRHRGRVAAECRMDLRIGINLGEH